VKRNCQPSHVEVPAAASLDRAIHFNGLPPPPSRTRYRRASRKAGPSRFVELATKLVRHFDGRLGFSIPTCLVSEFTGAYVKAALTATGDELVRGYEFLLAIEELRRSTACPSRAFLTVSSPAELLNDDAAILTRARYFEANRQTHRATCW